MPSIKRFLAEQKVKERRRERERLAKEIRDNQLKRNRDIRDAQLALARAKAAEDAKDAAERKAKAYGKLPPKKKSGIASLLSEAKKLGKDIDAHFTPKKKTVKRKKTVKKKITVKRTVKKTTVKPKVKKIVRKPAPKKRKATKKSTGKIITIRVN